MRIQNAHHARADGAEPNDAYFDHLLHIQTTGPWPRLSSKQFTYSPHRLTDAVFVLHQRKADKLVAPLAKTDAR